MRPDFILVVILGAAALTFALRYVPMVLVRRLAPSSRVERFLKTLPIGILAALVAQSLFLRGSVLDPGLANYYLHGFVAVIALAAWTRSLPTVVFGGLAVVALLTWLGTHS